MSFGVVYANGAIGVYRTVGGGVTTPNLGISADVTCMFETKAGMFNRAAAHQDPFANFSGESWSSEVGYGPLSRGVDYSSTSTERGLGDLTLEGNHIGLGPSLAPWSVSSFKTDAEVRCATGCVSSRGDPHLTTADGTSFDFQGAGEYLALTSSGGTILVVQVRQELYLDYRTVTVNTGYAFNVAGDRVAVYRSSDTSLFLSCELTARR